VRFLIIIIMISFILMQDKKVDLNNCSYDDIISLSLSKDKTSILFEYLNSNSVETVYDLINIEGISIEDVHLIRPFVTILLLNEGGSYSYKESLLRSNYGSSDFLGEIHKNLYYSKKNINIMNYDELICIPNVSPIDVTAILKQKQRGEIKGTFQLKNSPGISHYGYKNVLDYVSFYDNKQDFKIRIKSRVTNIPSTSVDEESMNINYSGETPSRGLKFYLENNYFNMGLLRYNNAGDLDNVYTHKKFVSFDDILLGSNNFKIDNIILGNFVASFGQGLIFESSDHFRPRKTGYKYTKRLNGIFYDHTDSQQYTLFGSALQLSNNFLRVSLFASQDKRDAITNIDGSFTNFISLYPRNSFGYENSNNKIHGDMLDAVTERTYGGNIRVSPFVGTNFGFTFYESLYDKVLDPQIINSVVGGDDDEIPFLDPEDWDNYSGDVYYLNYAQSNSCDPEIAAMYSSEATSDFWNHAKSFRRVSGFEFSTVIKNISFQIEYGEMNVDLKKLFTFNDGDPRALVMNAYMQFDSFNFLVLHRDYDLDYDNPYQRSFAAYQRYKSSILEDDYWLEDPMFTLLHSANPQPQAEKGTYVESRFQFHENFISSFEWDSWLRKADNAKYYRLVSKIEWRPLFNFRVYLRHKLQARGAFSLNHPSPYDINEARIRFKLRLSNYDNIELLYSYNYAEFSPRPRLTSSANPFIYNMDTGNIGSPDEAIGFSLEHNHSDQMKIKAGAVYVNGFMWYVYDNIFTLHETTYGLVNTWLSLDYKPNPFLSLKFQVAHTSDYPTTTIVNSFSQEGQFMDNPLVHTQKFNYTIQFNYAL